MEHLQNRWLPVQHEGLQTTSFSCESSGLSRPLMNFFIVISVPSAAPRIINMEVLEGQKQPEHHTIRIKWWFPLCVIGDVNWLP